MRRFLFCSDRGGESVETIYTFIKEIEKYHAHIVENEEIIRKELLIEHIDCTMKYFKLLAKEKQFGHVLKSSITAVNCTL